MPVVPDDLVRTLRRRDAERRVRWQVQAEALRAVAGRIADGLVERWAATEVWIFGSLVMGGGGGEPDIDLAVRGIAASDFHAAWSWAEEQAGTRVDLIDLADAGAPISAAVRQSGLRLR